MTAFDTLLLGCECSESYENKGGDPGTPGARQAMHDYANAGGRVIATHFQNTWIRQSPQLDWQQLSSWGGTGPTSGHGRRCGASGG